MTVDLKELEVKWERQVFHNTRPETLKTTSVESFGLSQPTTGSAIFSETLRCKIRKKRYRQEG